MASDDRIGRRVESKHAQRGFRFDCGLLAENFGWNLGRRPPGGDGRIAPEIPRFPSEISVQCLSS